MSQKPNVYGVEGEYGNRTEIAFIWSFLLWQSEYVGRYLSVLSNLRARKKENFLIEFNLRCFAFHYISLGKLSHDKSDFGNKFSRLDFEGRGPGKQYGANDVLYRERNERARPQLAQSSVLCEELLVRLDRSLYHQPIHYKSIIHGINFSNLIGTRSNVMHNVTDEI